MSKHHQATVVADIALQIPENATSRDILAALNKAYREGFNRGFMSLSEHHNAVQGVISNLLERV